MSRAPLHKPTLDTIASAPLTDPEPARVILLATAEKRQHALMTGWGAPAHWVDCRIGPLAIRTVQLRVPPGCMHMQILALATGPAVLAVTSSSDATGTKLLWMEETADNIHSAELKMTGGVMDSSLGAWSARHVEVAASVTWAWSNELVTINSTTSAPGGEIYGVGFKPVFQAV